MAPVAPVCGKMSVSPLFPRSGPRPGVSHLAPDMLDASLARRLKRQHDVPRLGAHVLAEGVVAVSRVQLGDARAELLEQLGRRAQVAG